MGIVTNVKQELAKLQLLKFYTQQTVVQELALKSN